MEIKKIVDYVNRTFIASDYLREPDIYYYMDLVIDDINERLNSKFPTFTDWKDFCAEWNSFFARDVNPDGTTVPSKSDTLGPAKNPFDHKHPHPVLGYAHLPIELVETPIPRPLPLRDNTKYDAFPDKYLRTVVALGVAVKFYSRDEEGDQVALDYQNRYLDALFKMTRDYHNQVPWYFQDHTGGYIDFTYIEEMGPCDLNPRGVVMRGNNTKGL